MGTKRGDFSRLVLIFLAAIVGVAAPLHALAAHDGVDAAEHLHSTCGVCFTLAGAEYPHICIGPTAAADEPTVAVADDQAAGSLGAPAPSDPTRAPPSLLA